MSLALWLRAGRAHRGMSVFDVAKITKIQPRILERLEAGDVEGLPADVFVRGFVRSFARCVGLEEAEALRRYAACGLGAPGAAMVPAATSSPEVRGTMEPSGTPEPPTGQVAAGTADLTPTARALVEAMAELVPSTSEASRGGWGPDGPAGGAGRSPVQSTANPFGQSPNGSPVPGREATRAPEGSGLTATAATMPSAAWVTPRAVVAVDATELAAGSLQDLPLSAVEDTPAVMVDAVPAVCESTVSPAVLRPPVAESAAESTSEASCGGWGPDGSAGGAGRSPVPSTSEASRGGWGPDGAAGGASSVPEVGITSLTPSPVAPVAMPGHRGNDSKKKRRRAKRDKRHAGSAPSRPSRELMATGTPAGASPIAASTSEASQSNDGPTATWAPKMPPAAPSVPWRKPAYAAAAGAMVPSLIIDDADPDSAERVLEERAEKHGTRRSFLPPILLDREDRSARQGGLTLAVIILLIAATLTLSYLMRRPSASGDGMTQRPAPASKLG